MLQWRVSMHSTESLTVSKATCECFVIIIESGGQSAGNILKPSPISAGVVCTLWMLSPTYLMYRGWLLVDIGASQVVNAWMANSTISANVNDDQNLKALDREALDSDDLFASLLLYYAGMALILPEA